MITTFFALAAVCLLSLAFILVIPHFAAAKVLTRFLPRDVREAAKAHPDPPLGRQAAGYLLTALAAAGYVGFLFFLGADGIRRGYGFWPLFGPFMLFLYGYKLFDILVQDQFQIRPPSGRHRKRTEQNKKHLRGDKKMGLFRKFVSQTRKPEGFLGKVMLSGMNSGHAAMADWGFSHLPPIAPERAVDLGCGGGRNAGELLKKYPGAHVTAIDYSGLSVEKAKACNQAAIAEGRCEVRQGDVSDLRLPDSSFDLATAFETVYFWPGLERCFAQVARILKPGGIFMICNESDGMDDTGKKYEGIIEGMKCYTAEQLEAALKAAGFSGVTDDHHPSKPWITVIARK